MAEERKQRRLFEKRRAGIVLSEDEVKAIKAGRKKLRKEMKARGIKSKKEFELTASSLGLYFDKRRPAFLLWLLGHWLGALIAALLAFLLILFLFAMVQRMRGHFTINLSDGMFKDGFTLSETEDFANPSTQLFATPAEDVPCISISQIPVDVNEIDGEHNETYFAYTYYLRNEGENTVGYTWSLDMNTETQNVSEAVWAMVFEDGKMRFYAKPNQETGQQEALPAFNDNDRGYIDLPIKDLEPDSDQFEVVGQRGKITYWRVIPDNFLSDKSIATGQMDNVEPMEIHKYTVVLWLEGDDADADDSMIGGHLGVEMNYRLIEENDDSGQKASLGSKIRNFWKNIWSGLDEKP